MLSKSFHAILLAVTVFFSPAAFAQKAKVPQFTPANCAILLIDHQTTILDWTHSQDKESIKNNLVMIARLGTDFKTPLILTTTMEENIGSTWDGLQKVAPIQYSKRIKRGGTLNTFADPKFSAAVKATGKKKLIVAGLLTEVCLVLSVEAAIKEGYEVMVVADACGALTTLADQLTFDHLRELGVAVVSAQQALTELYPDFDTADGKKAQKISLDEVVSKIPK